MRSIECSTSAYSLGKLTLVLSTGKFGVLAEEEKDFASYSAASVASCKWVDSGRDKIDPLELEVYVSRMKVSPAFGKVVGVYSIHCNFCTSSISRDLRTAVQSLLVVDRSCAGVNILDSMLSDRRQR
ncbi:hypothetical protein L210DRAFT_3589296 [Boletus edulis BED1]|uniref:Uncharacterized protein n=1 Tax=Boletus edulis BED1 TaxID=1328754 RepID=A0AAD4B9J2_BOLED|nr:hypothetical protein L210DRAFT_3589296 [Boletus edulis BED1]